jgi:hypothetical protein
VGYYIRAFCVATLVPPLREPIEWARRRGIELEISPDSGAVNLDDSDWERVHLFYKEGKRPLILECNRDDGSAACLAREEVQEFLSFLLDVEASPVKRRVEQHLKETKVIISAQLLSDIDDDGYNAVGELLKFFVEQNGGMIQADGEGFYEGNEVVLPLD